MVNCCSVSKLVDFGSLEPAFTSDGVFFYNRSISIFEEDKRNPGSFLIDNYGRALLRFTPGADNNITLLCGSLTERDTTGLGEGSALDARFHMMVDITQGDGFIFITDFQARCIKRYDFVTQNVTIYVGQCNNDDINDRYERPQRLAKGPISANQNWITAPTSFISVRNGEYYIITSFNDENIYKFDPVSHTVDYLSREQQSMELPDYSGFLLNQAETRFYTFRKYGLSYYDIPSHKTHHLTGKYWQQKS